METCPSMDLAEVDETEYECVPMPPIEIIEENLVIQDIELDSLKTATSMDHEISQIQEEANLENVTNSNALSEIPHDSFGCAQVIDMIMKTIQKYMKNTLMSLLHLTFLLPWYSTGFYGFITNSGCEDPNIKVMAKMSEYGLYMVTIFLPLVIKFKLDRLSEFYD